MQSAPCSRRACSPLWTLNATRRRGGDGDSDGEYQRDEKAISSSSLFSASVSALFAPPRCIGPKLRRASSPATRGRASGRAIPLLLVVRSVGLGRVEVFLSGAVFGVMLFIAQSGERGRLQLTNGRLGRIDRRGSDRHQ